MKQNIKAFICAEDNGNVVECPDVNVVVQFTCSCGSAVAFSEPRPSGSGPSATRRFN